MRCGELGVPEGAIEGGRIIDPAAVGNTLRQLLARTDITTSRALIAASDVIASFRVLTFPDDTGEEAIDAVVKSQLPATDQRLALRRIEVLTAHPGRTVYAAVWDRTQVKAIAECARNGGVEPAVIDLKSLCIARAVPLSSCIVLDMSDEPHEILLIDAHIPRVWHSIPPDFGSDLVTGLATGLKPVLGFYRQVSGDAFPADSPIVIRSDEPPAADMAARLAEVCGRPVEALPRPARIDPDLRFGSYLPCVGLVMRRLA
jgi:hypothetical protein